MPATSTDQSSLRRWNVASTILLILYALSLGIFALAVSHPKTVRAVGLGAYTRERAWWPILVQIALGAAAFATYYWPRHREARNFLVVVTGVLAATTILIGVAAYWGCPSTAGESTFWTPLTDALNLLFGNIQECYVGDVVKPAPPALQLTRLSGMLVLISAALGVVASIFRGQIDWLVVRFSRSLVILVGLTRDAESLIRRLGTEREADTTLAVIVSDPGNVLIKSARNLGARVVVGDVNNRSALSSLLTAGGKFQVRSFHAVSADVAENLRWAAQLRAVADSTKPSRMTRPPRMIVRIDDPWQAEYWRRTNAYRTPASETSIRWISDALSVYEVTAELILDRVLDPNAQQRFDRLVIVGNSTLALALCAELAQREREGRALSAPPHLGLADLILFGPEAETLREQHRLRQERFGNSGELDLITVVESKPTSEYLRATLQHDQHPALILAGDPAVTGQHQATYLAALNPSWTIFNWSPTTKGVANQPIMERLYPFGLTLEAPGSLPVDSWERAARIVHEQYRQTKQRDSGKSSDKPWEQLDPFLRQSNIRQVTTALAAAESLGRSWGPVESGVTPADLVASEEFSAADLETMARREHESWMRYYLANRWHYGPTRDDQKRHHPSLRSWEMLDHASQETTREGVERALNVLKQLGYRSTVRPQDARSDGADRSKWITASRRGEVTAVLSDSTWSWTNESGETMQGEAGDWRLTNDSGRSWSVAPDIFARTYEHVAGDRWRRIGHVLARPAEAGEVVDSLEGQQTTVEGDWVMRGAQDERWVTTGEHFAASYEVSEPESLGTPRDREEVASPAPPAD
jgi:RyR domain